MRRRSSTMPRMTSRRALHGARRARRRASSRAHGARGAEPASRCASTPPASPRRSRSSRIRSIAASSSSSSRRAASASCAAAPCCRPTSSISRDVVACRRRARPARPGVRARRVERPLLRQLHRIDPATPSSRGSGDRPIRSSPIRRRASICAWAAGRRRDHRAAVRESQRRPPRLRTGRLSLHRPRRRRLGRRSRSSRAESAGAARQDAAHRRQRARHARDRLSGAGRQPVRRRPADRGARPRSGRSACAIRGATASTIPARGGTGALVIGDVGQNAFEEIDYEPPDRGGRNYGWRNREGRARQRHVAPAGVSAAHRSDPRVRPRVGTVDHRRLRLSRPRARRGVSAAATSSPTSSRAASGRSRSTIDAPGRSARVGRRSSTPRSSAASAARQHQLVRRRRRRRALHRQPARAGPC